MSPNLFNLYSEYLTQEALENLEDFKSGGQEIRTVKYSKDFVLLGKKETMLQGTTGRLIEIVRCYGMEMNVEKPEVMSILRQRSPVEASTDYGRSEHLENVEYSMIKNDTRCTRETKAKIVMEKAAFRENTRTLFT